MSQIATIPKRVRCAVYTRKSSEEGLDMEFNSLEAQREACEAYVASQKAEGWTVIRERYDDGGFSGGTAASLKATMAALSKDPSLFALMVDPFALTPGFKGPEQPRGDKVEEDKDLGATVGPFVMAAINTRNVHRSNLLTGHAYGEGLVYDEMVVVDPNAPPAPALGAEGGAQPGEGPSKEERETGFFDVLFIGLGEGDEQMRVAVTGDKDPGYGCTSKMIGEAAICLINEATDAPGGVWTPGAAMGMKLIERLRANAGMTFEVEA